MDRPLVVFDRPQSDSLDVVAAAWDTWLARLTSRGLQLVSDLDPVAVEGYLEIYEVAPTPAAPVFRRSVAEDSITATVAVLAAFGMYDMADTAPPSLLTQVLAVIT